MTKKKHQLYVKLPNGRYQPYVEEKVDTRLYVKRGGKYIPWAMDMRSTTLDEGVWVVTNHRHSTSYANATHLYEAYKCIKCGDIVEAPSLAELGGYEKLAAHLLQNWSEVDTTCVDTICKSVVGILMKYKKEEK